MWKQTCPGSHSSQPASEEEEVAVFCYMVRRKDWPKTLVMLSNEWKKCHLYQVCMEQAIMQCRHIVNQLRRVVDAIHGWVQWYPRIMVTPAANAKDVPLLIGGLENILRNHDLWSQISINGFSEVEIQPSILEAISFYLWHGQRLPKVVCCTVLCLSQDKLESY